jgi:hypothetical protein
VSARLSAATPRIEPGEPVVLVKWSRTRDGWQLEQRAGYFAAATRHNYSIRDANGKREFFRRPDWEVTLP